jgi:hypothetical protein
MPAAVADPLLIGAGALDLAVPAGAAVLSALVTFLLGRRNAQGAEDDRAYTQAWRLVEELRAELDRLRVRVGELEAQVEAQDRQHEVDRRQWQTERRALIAAFRAGEEAPPLA